MKRGVSLLLVSSIVVLFALSCENTSPPPPTILYEQNFNAIDEGAEPTGWNEFYHLDGYNHPKVTAEKALYFDINTMSYGYLGVGADEWGDIQVDFDINYESVTDDPRLPLLLRIIPYNGSPDSDTYLLLNIYCDGDDPDSYGAYEFWYDSSAISSLTYNITSSSIVPAITVKHGIFYHFRIKLIGNTLTAYFNNSSEPFFEHTYAGITPYHPLGFIGFLRNGYNYTLDNMVVTDL